MSQQEITITDRHGLPDARFKGRLLARAGGKARTAKRWVEIEVYEHEAGGYVAVTIRKTADGNAAAQVERLETLEEVADHLGNRRLAKIVKTRLRRTEKPAS